MRKSVWTAGAASYSSFSSVTNPHDFTIDGVHIIGTSGQNVNNMAKYVDTDDRCVNDDLVLKQIQFDANNEE